MGNVCTVFLIKSLSVIIKKYVVVSSIFIELIVIYMYSLRKVGVVYEGEKTIINLLIVFIMYFPSEVPNSTFVEVLCDLWKRIQTNCFLRRYFHHPHSLIHSYSEIEW